MPQERKSPPSPDDRGAGRRQGSGHHGWAPDVDETRQQDNPSARRSFHAEEHAPARGPGRKRTAQEHTPTPGDIAKGGRRGEEHGAKPEEGMRDTGERGRSGRPSGTKDESAFTGVDPDGGESGRRPG
ncbi:hypothetical protein ACGF7W_08160 [Streptomyces sp. NPDC048219]|uniref:hypothetical protein n=1 Tax=unclassified Streptomyces TaxID=2593676 RepID=UPI00341A2133